MEKQHDYLLFNKAPKQACHNSIIPYYSTKPFKFASVDVIVDILV
ncbi:hypothetical protein [Candidatus Symbiopectobacterium sp.]|nr:hypothetical protein [Candidatus Symbiopectobacterium sp.]